MVNRLLTWVPLLPATLLRVARFTERPFHHDEGVNGWFFLRLWAEGHYRYDPANYHGPTLYFLSLPAAWLAGGPSDAVLRGVAAAASLAAVGLLPALAGSLGRSGAAAAALLLGVSPAAVYFGRDYIHESLFAFLTLATIVLGERFARTGRTWTLVGAGVAAGLLVATKETAVPTLGLLALGLFAAAPKASLRLLARPWPLAAAAVALAVVVAAAYTNGFSEPGALLDPVRALPQWIARGTAGAEHAHPPLTYLRWLARMEAGLVAIGTVGVVLAVATGRPFDRFVAVWTAGTLLFYSALSYKTPWLVVDLVLPLALAAGVAVREVWQGASREPARRLVRRAAVVGLVVGVAAAGARRAADAALVRYDDPAVVYPYAQTVRGYRGLLTAVARATAGRDPATVRIAITAPEYWPLPWDLRRFPQTAWFGRPMEGLDHELVIAAAAAPAPVGEPARYDRAVYPLRPGVDLALYVRR